MIARIASTTSSSIMSSLVRPEGVDYRDRTNEPSTELRPDGYARTVTP
jgi:hypothetical protein